MFLRKLSDWRRKLLKDYDANIKNLLPALCVGVLAFWWIVSLFFQPGHPPIGTYIAILACVAGLMTIWPPDNAWAKFGWAVIYAALLFLEVNAIYQQKHEDEVQVAKDRKDETNRFANIRIEEDDRFAALLKSQNESFETVLKQNQQEFDKTIRNLSGISSRIDLTAKENLRRFSDVVSTEQELFNHEEELADALRGKLAPGNDPVPANNCGRIPEGSILLMFGKEEQHNAALVSVFPHVVLSSNSRGPVVSLERAGDKIAVILDLRSTDGRIMARLDSNGWVLNRNNVLAANKDSHSLEVLDEYGAEVLSVRYLNRQAISIRGKEIGLPPAFSFVCSSNAKSDFAFP